MADTGAQTTDGVWQPEFSASPLVGGSHLAITRLWVAVIAFTASFAGLLPALLFLRTEWLLPIVAAALLVLMLFTSFHVTPVHLRRPPAFEVITVWLTTISQGALVAFIALTCYVTVLYTGRLLGGVAGLIGWNLTSDWSGAARVGAYFFGGVMLLGISTTSIKGVFRALYPPVSARATPFREFARTASGRTVVGVTFVVTIAVAVFAITSPAPALGIWWYFFISVALVMATAVAWETTQKQVAPRTFSNTEEAIGAMLRSLEFTVVEQPRTGLPQIDPHLSDLAFAASRNDRSFAVQVMDAGQAMDPVAVSRAAIAANALSTVARGRGDDTVIEPVVVAVGEHPPSDCLAFAATQDVIVIHVPDLRIISGETAEGLREHAAQLFGVLLGETRPAAPSGLEAYGTTGFSLAQNRARQT